MSAVARVSVTRLPATAAVAVTADPATSTAHVPPVPAGSSGSSNASSTLVPSVEVWGAAAPVVTSVGRMASTVAPASAGTASWVRSAWRVVAVAMIVSPSESVNAFAGMAMPSASTSSTITM